MEKHIILNADDYGANDFIDKAIIKAVETGKVSSVSAFVTHADSLQRIERLKTQFPDLGIGLHFSITSGTPVSEQHSVLTDPSQQNGVFFQVAQNYSYKPAVKKAKEISLELPRQLDKLKEVMGSYDAIDHVTVHHNLTNFELKYYYKKVKLLASLGIPMRSLNAWSSSLAMVDDYDNNRFELAPVLKQGLRLNIFNIDMLAERKRKRFARKRGLKYPDYLCDVIYGQPSKKQYDFLLNHFQGDIDDQEYSIEFMLHLGDKSQLSDDQYANCESTHGINAGYYDTRQKEFEVLMEYPLDEKLEVLDVEKSSYRDLDFID